jgi:hypothetical protein
LWLTDDFSTHNAQTQHEKHPLFTRNSNPVPLGLKSGALTTELPGHFWFDWLIFVVHHSKNIFGFFKTKNEIVKAQMFKIVMFQKSISQNFPIFVKFSIPKTTVQTQLFMVQ